MRRADMYAGLIIIAVAAAFGAGSLAMPWLESEWGIYAAPGLVPLLLSVLLIITGLVLVIRSVTAKELLRSPGEGGRGRCSCHDG